MKKCIFTNSLEIMNGHKKFPQLPTREKEEETTLQKTYSNVR
jgi:hypothetical protein